MRVSVFDKRRNLPSGKVGVEHAKFHLNVLPDLSPKGRERQTAPKPRKGKCEHLTWELRMFELDRKTGRTLGSKCR